MADQTLLFGEYSRKLDERHRISIPTELLEGLVGEETRGILVKEQTGALSLWNAEAWQQRHESDISLLQQKLQSGRLETRRHELQVLGRLLSTRHREVPIAGRSRILVPEGFREFLGVEPGSEVIIVGAAVCIEFWRPDAWSEHLKETIPDFERMLQELSG